MKPQNLKYKIFTETISIASIIIFSIFLLVPIIHAQTLTQRLAGRILLQVESKGEAWYVDPVNLKRTYLADGSSAYQLLRDRGLGITNNNLKKIPLGFFPALGESPFYYYSLNDQDNDLLGFRLEQSFGTDPVDKDTDNDGFDDWQEVRNNFNPLGLGKHRIDTNLINRLRGRILLQVESRGEAWYVHPEDGKRYYLPNGEGAYQIMRALSLGITNNDLKKITTDKNYELVLQNLIPPVGFDDYIRGDVSAQVTMIEYSDFECPFCLRHAATLDKILNEYAGKVRLVYRHMPLSFHQQAQKAAEAFECAGEQGGAEKAYAMHDKIFQANESNTMSVVQWELIAQELGLNTAVFNACIDSGKYAEKIKKQSNDAVVAGVSGTPTTFVNGKMITGAIPYDQFKSSIEESLK